MNWQQKLHAQLNYIFKESVVNIIIFCCAILLLTWMYADYNCKFFILTRDFTEKSAEKVVLF